MSLKVNKILGQMPSFWDRRAVFFANILSIFYGNESEIGVLQEEVGSLETYGSRLIPILDLLFTKGDNLLVLHRAPEEELLSYFRDGLGLTLPEIKIAPRQLYTAVGQGKNEEDKDLTKFLSNISKHPAEWVDGYVTDFVLVHLANILNKKSVSSSAGSKRGNNKLLLYKHILEKKLPSFDTYVGKNPEEARKYIKELRTKGYQKIAIKAAIGASGIGMKKINFAHGGGDVDIPDYFFYEGDCLVQGWLDESLGNLRYVGSPSVQMFIDDESLSLNDITEQILDKNSVHQGNIAPPEYLTEDKETVEELLRQAQSAGTWLYAQGYRGTGSVDFQIIDRAGRREVRICEINARVTGATYPGVLARHLTSQGSWLMRNISFTPPLEGREILRFLKEAGLLYQKGKREGVLPFNFNQNEEGLIRKGQFLFLGPSVQDTLSLLKKAGSIKSLKGYYDRD